MLHTRISEQLSDDIRRLAEDLRVPASNLVRNVLEEVFTVVETVSEDVGELFEEVVEETEGARGRIRDRLKRRSRARRHRRHRDRESDEEVERELERDESEESASGQPRRVFPDVLGWQPLVLNRSARCADCGRELARGRRAFVGLGEAGPTGTTLCRRCTDAQQ